MHQEFQDCLNCVYTYFMVVYDKICTINTGVQHVNRGDTPESGWIDLKVGIQCVLFLVGFWITLG